MTNIDVAGMTKDDFLAAYEKAKSEKKEKEAINTATIPLEEQLNRFNSCSLSEEDVKALHQDALSV